MPQGFDCDPKTFFMNFTLRFLTCALPFCATLAVRAQWPNFRARHIVLAIIFISQKIVEMQFFMDLKIRQQQKWITFLIKSKITAALNNFMKLLPYISASLLLIALIFALGIGYLADGQSPEAALAFVPIIFFMDKFFSIFCLATYVFNFLKCNSFLNCLCVSFCIMTAQCLAMLKIYHKTSSSGQIISIILLWFFASILPCFLLKYIKLRRSIYSRDSTDGLQKQPFRFTLIRYTLIFIITFYYIKVVFFTT